LLLHRSWSRIYTPGRANGVLSYFQLGYEGLSSGGTKLNSILITAELGDEGSRSKGTKLIQIFIKAEAKIKATPKRLSYADSDKEILASKSQKTPSKNKEPVRLRTSRRLEDRSITKEKTRRKGSKFKGKKSGYQETSSKFEHEEGLEDTYEYLNSPYKRPKPTPFTHRITRFKYHRRAKIPRKIRIYEGNKDLEDHLDHVANHGRYCKTVLLLLCCVAAAFVSHVDICFQTWCTCCTYAAGNGLNIWNNAAIDLVCLYCSKGEQKKNSSNKVTAATMSVSIGYKIQEQVPLLVIRFVLSDLWVTMGEAGNCKTMPIEFTIVKCRSLYNVIIGRTRMSRSSRIYHPFYDQIPSNLRNRDNEDKQGGFMGMVLADQRGWNVEVYLEEIVIKSKNEYNLIQDVEQTLGSEGTAVPRFVMEHQLKIYPLVEPIVHKRRPMTPDGRQALKEKVFYWLKERIIRKVWHPDWVANAIHIRLASGAWKLAAIDKFVPKLAELKHRVRKVRMKLEAEEGSGWTGEAEEAFRKIKRKLSKPQVLTLLKDGVVLMLCLRLQDETISSLLLVEKEGIQIPISYMSRPLQGCKSIGKEISQAREHKLGTSGASREETIPIGKELEPNLTSTPKACRLYIGNVKHSRDCEALLAGLVTLAGQGIKDLHVFIDSPTLAAQIEGSYASTMRQERKYKEEIMDAISPFHKFQITHLSKILNPKAEVLTSPLITENRLTKKERKEKLSLNPRGVSSSSSPAAEEGTKPSPFSPMERAITTSLGPEEACLDLPPPTP
nr:hypothetical protein [Tanacetum cinerariifolium]